MKVRAIAAAALTAALAACSAASPTTATVQVGDAVREGGSPAVTALIKIGSGTVELQVANDYGSSNFGWAAGAGVAAMASALVAASAVALASTIVTSLRRGWDLITRFSPSSSAT